MSVYTPPTKTAIKFSPARIALAVSLVLHLGATAFFARNTPPAPGHARFAVPPYTAKTYARHANDAQSEVKKLADVANALEKIKQERAASSDDRADSTNAERAAKEAADAQQDASAAQQQMRAAQTEATSATKAGNLPRARAASQKALAASERARTAQAKAFLAQDRLSQQLLRPTEKPTPQQAAAKTKIEHALKQQAAAQSALRQAQDALRQAARATTPAQQQAAQARAQAASQQAQVAQQAAGRAQTKAREPVVEQVRVARYDREKTPTPPAHPSGPTERIIIASTKVEEKTAQVIPAQEQAQVKLEQARQALAGGDREAAQDALKAAEKLQRDAQTAQQAARQTLKANGATIPGKAQAQGQALRQAANLQKSARNASEAAQKALSSGSAEQAANALARADAAQKKAAAKQEATLKSLQGAFGAKPAPPKEDPNHKHGQECFAPGGT